MNDTVSLLRDAKAIVIKIGSVLVTDKEKGVILQGWLDALAQDVKSLADKGKRIVIVSSGAVALGRNAVGIAANTPPGSIPLELKQAASAVGQFHLFNGYYKAFSALDLQVAQVLLTMSETENRRMHLNARETLNTLMERGIIPVIYENDTISTGEIRFGDNDRLAARVGQMISADVVILLSTIEGLYTADPNKDKNAQHIPLVKEVGESHAKMAGEAIPGLSTGGMKSKIEAASVSTRAGVPMLIAKGVEAHSLKAIVEDKNTKTTLFLAQETSTNARQRWIQAHVSPKGGVFIDDGALKALKGGKSLLPIGIKKIEGKFERGDPVKIKTLDGKQIGIGLAAYNAEDAAKIIGKQSSEIANILGYVRHEELIHRNDMVLS
jgi:glutamate 5-kinase